jgi:hypothetical protein
VWYRDYVSAHYFLENTSLVWYIRTTYDVYIRLPHYVKALNYLNHKYDPLKAIVFKGEMMGRGGDPNFIHGGPGWIMSRAAVERYISMEGSLSGRYANFIGGDDQFIVEFMRSMELKFQDIYEPWFSGPPIVGIFDELNLSRNFSVITGECDPSPGMHDLVKVNELVFLHNSPQVNWAFILGNWFIAQAPDDIFINPGHHSSRLCRKAGVQNLWLGSN